MRHSPKHVVFAGILLFLLVWIASCGPAPSPNPKNLPTRAVPTGASIQVIAQQVLTNMHLYSWNPNAMTGGMTTGGLVINWKMDDPAVINMVRPGPDGNPLHNHDPQVDLLYLMALADYSQLHPSDTTFNSDLARMLPFIHTNFNQYNLPKGWIYFGLLKIAQYTHNSTLMQDAYNTAKSFYQSWYDSSLGLVYDNSHFPGDYATSHSLQCGAALIDAGIHWNQPNWVTAGEKTIDHILAIALDPTYHLFYNSMTVSYRGQDTVENYQFKPSTQGDAIDALVTAYSLTAHANYLAVAKQVLSSMFGSIGLWDQKYGGFSFAYDPSIHKLETDYKETRSQSIMLYGIHHYNQISPDFIPQEQQLTAVIVSGFYNAKYHGFFYRVAPDFSVYVSHTSSGSLVTENYFTTEAMGSTLDALMIVEPSMP